MEQFLLLKRDWIICRISVHPKWYWVIGRLCNLRALSLIEGQDGYALQKIVIPMIVANCVTRVMWRTMNGFILRLWSRLPSGVTSVSVKWCTCLMYTLSIGYQWQAISKDLPPRSTLFEYFDLWDYDGTLDRTHQTPRSNGTRGQSNRLCER